MNESNDMPLWQVIIGAIFCFVIITCILTAIVFIAIKTHWIVAAIALLLMAGSSIDDGY